MTGVMRLRNELIAVRNKITTAGDTQCVTRHKSHHGLDKETTITKKTS